MKSVRPRKILLIEDEDDLRFTLARAVAMTPRTLVLEAADVQSARRYIGAHPDIALAITDIRLPDGNGLDLIREVRGAKNYLPFIVITGYHSADVVLEAYRLGALRYLAKPFDLETFVNTVNETLNWAHLVYGVGDGLVTPMQGWVEITSPARYEIADRMRDFLAALSSFNLSSDELKDLQLAVEELVQNAIEWGDKENPEKSVHVSYALFSDRALIMVKDEGEGFNPAEVPDPTSDPFAHLQKRLMLGKRVGGYGIHLTRKLVDDIMYNADGNAVIITKYLPGAKRRE